MEKLVVQILSSLSKTSAFIYPDVKQEDSKTCINGINVMRIPSRDAYAFALQLVDVLFTKEELASSLLFKSKKVASLDWILLGYSNFCLSLTSDMELISGIQRH